MVEVHYRLSRYVYQCCVEQINIVLQLFYSTLVELAVLHLSAQSKNWYTFCRRVVGRSSTALARRIVWQVVFGCGGDLSASDVSWSTSVTD